MEQKEKKILFMGDSITDGNRYKTKEESWDLNHQIGHSYVYIINGILGSQYPEKNLHFFNRGISGNRISDMYQRIEEDVLALQPDVLSLLAGINDGPLDIYAYQATKADEFECFYRKFLKAVKNKLPKTQIILMEPFVGCAGNRKDDYPIWRTTIEEFADRIRKLAEEFDAIFVPLQKIFDVYMKENDPEKFLWDGIHPTEAGHGLIAREWIACAGSKCIPEIFQRYPMEERNIYERPYQFDRKNTLKEIVGYPGLVSYFNKIFDSWLIEQIPTQEWEIPLCDVEKRIPKTQWGDPFSVIIDQLLAAANTALDLYVNQNKIMLPLWKLARMYTTGCAKKEIQDKAEQYTANVAKMEMAGENAVFLIAPKQSISPVANIKKEKMSAKKRPAVIICPGGGYTDVCFSNEGSPVQNFMLDNGYITFILKYRVAPDRYPIPQMDLALAILYIRANALSYDLDPDNILVMGFSAGGHLCASLGIFYPKLKEMVLEDLQKDMGQEQKLKETVFHGLSARPNKICLGYPVINFRKEKHEDSFLQLTGGEEKLRGLLSVDEHVGKKYPKTYIWACEDDGLVPASNATRMARALEEKGVPCYCHIYPEGGHGCGMAKAKSAAGWPDEMLCFMEKDTDS